jgi:hypothetical protein
LQTAIRHTLLQAASEDPDFDPCSADIQRQRRNGSKIARIWNYEATFNANVKGVLRSRIYQLRVSVRLQSVFKRPAASARTPRCRYRCRRTCLIASRGVTQRPKPCGCLNSGEGQCKMDMYPILVLLGAAIGIAILAVLQWRIVNDARSFVQGRSGFGWSVQKKPRSTRGYDVCVARRSIGARGGAVRPKRISILRPQSRARTISRVGVDARPRT